MLEATLGQVSAGRDLTIDEMAVALEAIMQGRCSESEIALLLTALSAKGETVDEVAGAAAVLRNHMTPIRTKRTGVIDTCGTGGDRSGTFNISTAAALVAAAAGAPVAKHGNRRVTSKTGSADVLAAMGVNIDASVEQVQACLDQLGICFCFAPLMHQSMKHVGSVRRKLGVPTIFNLLGPLCNPAGAPFQLVGVGKPRLRDLLAEALAKLGTERSLVVHGEDGLDEVTLGGTTHVSEAAGGKVSHFTWTPADFGLEVAGTETMRVDTPRASAAMIRKIFDGERGAPRDVVVLNAAAALWTAGKDPSTKICAERAAEAIDSGTTDRLLQRLIEMSNLS